jgi:hypothetical protein
VATTTAGGLREGATGWATGRTGEGVDAGAAAGEEELGAVKVENAATRGPVYKTILYMKGGLDVTVVLNLPKSTSSQASTITMIAVPTFICITTYQHYYCARWRIYACYARYNIKNPNLLTRGNEDFRHNARVLCLKAHGCFVCLNLRNYLARRKSIALFHIPCANCSRLG